MADARGRMLLWGEHAWVGSAREAQIFKVARYSLPGVNYDSPGFDDTVLAALHQRTRLRQDQQLAEWQASFGARPSRSAT